MLCFLQAHFRAVMWTLCSSSLKESAITFMEEVNCVFTRFSWSLAWTGDLPAQELHTRSLWIKGKGNLCLEAPLNSCWTNPEPHPELTGDYFNYSYLISFRFLVHLSFQMNPALKVEEWIHFLFIYYLSSLIFFVSLQFAYTVYDMTCVGHLLFSVLTQYSSHWLLLICLYLLLDITI